MYERFYGLRERPFALSPDPDYLYPGRVHREALDYLRYGLDSHAGFIVMTGEIGSGKTTLLQTLLRGLDSKTTVGRIVNTMLEPRELIETILIDFGLDATGRSKPMMLQDLAEYLVAQRVAGRMVLLVIDEAQNLPLAGLEELRMLSNIETEKSKLLQIVLVGQPNLRDKLAAPELEQLRQRITVSYHLLPLDVEETANYINHRLRRAALGVPPEFPRDVTNLIHARSRGVPRVVNVICDAALVFGYAEERRRIDLPLIHEVLTELETTGVLPPPSGAQEQVDVPARPVGVAAQPRSLPPAIPASTPAAKPISVTPTGRAESPSAPPMATPSEPATPPAPAPAVAAFAPRRDSGEAPSPAPAQARVDGSRPERVDGRRPERVEGPRREPAEEPRPERVEGPRPEPAEGPRPEPAEGPRPERVEGPRPEPVEGPRPEPAEGPRPVRVEGPRPGRVEATRDPAVVPPAVPQRGGILEGVLATRAAMDGDPLPTRGTVPIPPAARDTAVTNAPDPMQAVRRVVDEALLHAERDEAQRHPGRDERVRPETKEAEIRISDLDATSRAALDASLAQREAAIRQRERELAEQRRILAEEYRLLRSQRAAASVGAPPRGGAGGLPNLPSPSASRRPHIAQMRADQFWAWVKRIAGVSPRRVRHN